MHIQLNEPVSLNFSLRYLNNFAKATPMAMSVKVREVSGGGRCQE